MDRSDELLLAVLRGSAEAGQEASRMQSPTGSDWESILQSAIRHRLAPLLYKAVKRYPAADVPPSVLHRLRQLYYHGAACNMRIYRELAQVLRAFDAAGIPVILLKGAFLAEFVYENIALRPMGDIDLLLQKADLLRAHEVLLENGYSNSPKNMGNAIGHLPPYMNNNGITIEIHYTIFNPPFLETDVAGLWERARAVHIQGAPARALCPEDLLLHLSVHAALDHGFENGPLALFDMARVVERYRRELPWPSLLHRADQLKLARCLALTLGLTQRLTGLRLPESLNRDLKPGDTIDRELASAEELIFAEGTPVASDLARLFGSESIAAKLGYCLRQIFPPRDAMRSVHPQSRHGTALLAQYCYRLRGLFARQSSVVVRLLLRDQKISKFIRIENRRNQLRDWIIDNE